jgi:hypothetical protein
MPLQHGSAKALQSKRRAKKTINLNYKQSAIMPHR